MASSKNQLTLSDYKLIRTPFAFLDETGSINDKANRFFGLGMIKCMQPYYLDTQIRQLRQKMNFFDEVKWNTLSKAKMEFIKEALDITFKTPGINFTAIIINKDEVDFAKEFANSPYVAYQKFTESLLQTSIQDNEVLTVLADYMTTPLDVKFEVDTKHAVNEALDRLAIGGIHRVDSKGINLLQLTDLFLGAVIYSYKLQNKLVSGDKNKIEVIKIIQKAIEKDNLTELISRGNFRIIGYK
jgi:hypothetical protein